MGIKGFIKRVERQFPDAISMRDMSYLRGKTVLIDANNYVYKWYSIKVGDPNMNHLQGVFYRTLALLRAGATPVYVFDGVPPDEKLATIAARKHARESGGTQVPSQAFKDVKTIITLLGCDYIDAPGEAEAQCARMSRGDPRAIVMSDDSDTLAFGAAEIVRIQGKRLKVVTGAKIGNQDAIIDIAIAQGCDYEGDPQTIRDLFVNPVVDDQPKWTRGRRDLPAVVQFLTSASMNRDRVTTALSRFSESVGTKNRA